MLGLATIESKAQTAPSSPCADCGCLRLDPAQPNSRVVACAHWPWVSLAGKGYAQNPAAPEAERHNRIT